MDIVYTGEKFDENKKICFLAGPTPRDKDVLSWRGEAIKMFDDLSFSDIVYVPEFRHKSYYDYETGVNEMKFDQDMLERADVVMFWIPRSNNMLGLSTNIEFGYLLNKGNIVYGSPNNAMRCEFLDFLYKEKLGKNYLSALEDTVKETINVLKRVRK